MPRRLKSHGFLRLTAGALAVVLALWTGPAEASAALPHVREPAAASPALERVAAAAATTVTVGGNTTTLTWDYNQKLTGITYPNSSTNSFTNSDLGVRTAKTDSGGSTTYLRDGATVIADSRADYATGGTSGLISERASGTSKWYHADALGSTRGLTNSSQAVTDTLETDAWGLTVSSTGSTPSPFGFVGGQGYQSDPDSGLMLLGARYYDPSLGRFLSRDPLGYGGGDVNLYRYCGNDPVNGTDPSGLITRGGLWGALGGGLIAVGALAIVGAPITLPLLLGGVAVGAIAGSLREGNEVPTAINDACEAGTVTMLAGPGIVSGANRLLGPPAGGGVPVPAPGGGAGQGGLGSLFRGVGAEEAQLISEAGGAVASTRPGIPGITRVFPPEVAGRMDAFFGSMPPGTYTHVVEFPMTHFPDGAWLDSPWPTWIVPVAELNAALAGPPVIRPR